MEEEKPPQKWQGQVSAKLKSIQPDRAWSLLGDFLSLHKFRPDLTTCEKISGGDGDGDGDGDGNGNTPGCVRYCAGAPDTATGGVYWVKERLIAMDPTKRCYSYVIIDSNMGFGDYCATLRVVECDDGSNIEWEFESEPIVGWTRSGFVEYLEGGVKEMAKRVGEGLGVDSY